MPNFLESGRFSDNIMFALRLPLMNSSTLLRRALFLALLTASPVLAQSFSGVNSPGGFQDFPFSTGVGATNLAITLPGTPSAFSHLLLKAGGSPSDTNYDFIALANGTTNVINLEAPEFKATNYVLRVRTPVTSLTHSFTVAVLTNVADMRATNRPASKYASLRWMTTYARILGLHTATACSTPCSASARPAATRPSRAYARPRTAASTGTESRMCQS